MLKSSRIWFFLENSFHDSIDSFSFFSKCTCHYVKKYVLRVFCFLLLHWEFVSSFYRYSLFTVLPFIPAILPSRVFTLISFLFFLRIQRVTSSLPFLFHRWNAYFRSVHDYSQDICSLIPINNQQIRK